MSIEDDVRTALRSAADDLGEPVVPHRMLAAGLHRVARSRRRRRVGFAAAGVALAVVVTAVPIGIATLRSDPPSTAAPVTPSVDVLGLPTRGSLAGDQAFLDALVQLDWTVPGAVSGLDAPVATRRVVFAGDVPGGRWALVVGENPSPSTLPAEQQTDLGAMSAVVGLWFVGPEGAMPDQMVPVTIPRGLATDRVQSLADPSTGTVVVVGAPGDRIALSPAPVVAADATVSRSWTDVAADGGVAVGHLPVGEVAPPGTAGQFRVTRDGIDIDRRSPDGFIPDEGISAPLIPVEHLRDSVPPSDLMDQQDAADVLGSFGLGIGDVRFQVLWAGEIPGPDGDPTYASVMAASLPSGAVVLLGSELQLVSPGQGSVGATWGGGSGLRELQPAGPAVTDRVVAMRSEVSGNSGSPTVTSLVVVVPDGAMQVTALDDDGTELGTFPAVDGAAVAAFPEGTTSVAVTFADRSVRTVALGTYTGDF